MAIFECRLGRWIGAIFAEPSPSRFVVDESGRAVGGDFHLVAMDASVAIFWQAVAANLDAGIEPTVHQDLEAQFEVTVGFRTEEGVGTPLDGGSLDDALFYFIMRRAILLFPSFQALAVEEGDEILWRRRWAHRPAGA